jgi:hypothetical protein
MKQSYPIPEKSRKRIEALAANLAWASPARLRALARDLPPAELEAALEAAIRLQQDCAAEFDRMGEECRASAHRLEAMRSALRRATLRVIQGGR